MADNALSRGSYQNFLSRVPDQADVTGTAYDSNGPIWRALGVGSAMPLTQPKVGPLENPNAESDHTWQRTPGSPYELSKWKQNVQDVLGSPGVNEFMTAANFLAPRPGAMMLPKMPEKPQGIRAYHGSPHDFDRFRLDKIGTGEGDQAYGHGLYFAEKEATAKSYRDNLTSRNLAFESQSREMAARLLREHNENRAAALKEAMAAQKTYGGSLFERKSERVVKIYKEAEELLRGDWQPPSGHMYEVNINANPEHFLDWDKPLSQQSAAVQSKMREVVKPSDRMPEEWIRHSPGAEQRLRDAGIPGISYKDAGSRGSSGGTRNHVVFDENLISILRKYGLAGLMAGGAASQKPDAQQ